MDIITFLGGRKLFQRRGPSKDGGGADDVMDPNEQKEMEIAKNRRDSRGHSARRQGVSGEKYDPEADTEPYEPVVHEKTSEQREKLKEILQKVLQYKILDQQQKDQVVDAVSEKLINKGEVVIQQGDDGDNFYVIEEGKFDVLVNDQRVGEYDNSGSFGELALMYNQPRAATVIATTDGKVWALDRRTFQKICVAAQYNKRKQYAALLDGMEMLSQLTSEERLNVADALNPLTFLPGAVIIKQGDSANGMYFIQSGSCVVLREEGGVEKEVNNLSTGEYFGELALLTSKPRAATVKATTDGPVKLAFLDVLAFERLLGPCVEIMARNQDLYQEQITKVFGEGTDLSKEDLRK